MSRESFVAFFISLTLTACASVTATSQKAQSIKTLSEACAAYKTATQQAINQINAGKLTKSQEQAIVAASTDAQKYCSETAPVPTDLQAAITAVSSDTTTIGLNSTGATK